MKETLPAADHAVASLPVPLAGPSPAVEAAILDVPEMLGGTVVPIAAGGDIYTAREQGRVLAARLGFSVWDQTMIASTICELARNILEFATGGWIALMPETVANRVAFVIEACDHGPGIADPESAAAGGGSATRSPGFGLPGVNRLMDELDIRSELGKGTTVTAKKWRHSGPAGRTSEARPVPSGQVAHGTQCLTAP